MSLPADLALRSAVDADLPAIAELRLGVGWGVQEWALRAVLNGPDARCVVVTDGDGRLAGVGSGIAYGPLGFVGNMIVAAEHRRRGVGSAILRDVMRFLEEVGCRRLELNATGDGRPLYERHGFVRSGTQLSGRVRRGARLGPADTPVRELDAADLDGLAAYDAPRFGGDRRRLLATMLADPTRPVLGAERDGELGGYGWLRLDGERVGPLVADSPPIAAALVSAGLAHEPALDGLQLNLPSENAGGAAWLRGIGVQLEPWDGRMARGPQIRRRLDTIYGITVGALG